MHNALAILLSLGLGWQALAQNLLRRTARKCPGLI
jgi:hypothetical protein